MKSTQHFLIALLIRELEGSDLSELDEYIDIAKRASAGSEQSRTNVDNRLHRLFREVNDRQVTSTTLCSSEMLERLKVIRRSLLFALELSVNAEVYCGPIASQDAGFLEFLNVICRLDGLSDIPGASDAQQLILGYLQRPEPDSDWRSRSTWHKRLKNDAPAKGNYQDRRTYALAEALVDITYNYQNEASILNVSRHYARKAFETCRKETVDSVIAADDADHRGNRIRNAFEADVCQRVKAYWNEGQDWATRFLVPNSEVAQFSFSEHRAELPDWDRVIKPLSFAITRRASKPRLEKDATCGSRPDHPSGGPCSDAAEAPHRQTVPTYEQSLNEQEKSQRKMISRQLRLSALSAFLCVAIILILNLALGALQGYLEAERWFAPFIVDIARSVLLAVAFVLIGEAFNECISRHLKGFPSVFESFSQMIGTLRCRHYLSSRTRAKDDSGWLNGVNENCDGEAAQAPGRCAHQHPQRIEQYATLRSASAKVGPFKPLISIPLLGQNHSLSKEELIRTYEDYEIAYGNELGVVYASPYNTMVVDLVADLDEDGRETNELHPYERLLPAIDVMGDGGIVIITRRQGDYVLLEQERHATRSKQLCFPRGYSEPGMTPEDNVRKELDEELGAKILGDLRFIGTVAPDSGISGKTARVYLVDIASYSYPRDRREGIINVLRVDAASLQSLVAADRIDDGFTLAAWCLLQAKKLTA